MIYRSAEENISNNNGVNRRHIASFSAVGASNATILFTKNTTCYSIGDNPCTEKWQKTVGGHKIWISADATRTKNGKIHMSTTVRELDYYRHVNRTSRLA